MSRALAVRYRPTTWSEVTGQHHLVTVLRAASRQQQVPQQILLAGPSGVGKTTLARIFAAALFCPTPAPDGPCGVCETCLDVTGPGGKHPDVIEVDAASHGGIDQIRALADGAHMAPMLAPWRVYIIDEAHGLTAHGAQAFLRTLEEPPAHTIFVLATTDPQKLPDALRGRCLLCYATSPTEEEKVANLARISAGEGWNYDPDALRVVVDGTEPALGVRGTVTNLAKAQAAGCTSGGEVADLLGVVPPAAMQELVDALTAGDLAAAIVRTDELSARLGGDRVHQQLLAAATRRLHDQARTGTLTDAAAWVRALLTNTADRLVLALAQICENTQTPAASPAAAPGSPAAAPGSPVESSSAQHPGTPASTPPSAAAAPSSAPSGGPTPSPHVDACSGPATDTQTSPEPTQPDAVTHHDSAPTAPATEPVMAPAAAERTEDPDAATPERNIQHADSTAAPDASPAHDPAAASHPDNQTAPTPQQPPETASQSGEPAPMPVPMPTPVPTTSHSTPATRQPHDTSETEGMDVADLTDPDLVAWGLRLAKTNVRVSLALRRAHILRAGDRWHVTLPDDVTTHDMAAAVLRQTADPTWTVTVR